MAHIREITVDDAEAFVALLLALDNESKFLLFEPGERTLTVEQARRQIEMMMAEGITTTFVVEEGGVLVGFLRAIGNEQRRLRHTLYLVIALRQAFTGQGLGTQLFVRMEQWARARNLHRLALTVMTHNRAAIALYEKMGFTIEGLHKDAMLVDGHYVDEYTMAKLLT